MKTYRHLYDQVCDWDNLTWLIARHAKASAAGRRLPASSSTWRPTWLSSGKSYRRRPIGPAYTSFYIHEPKRRLISAAPFRDRVVHHALCNVIEPIFDRSFIFDSTPTAPARDACRAGSGQEFARRHAMCCSATWSSSFQYRSCDPPRTLAHKIADPDVLWLVDQILASGIGVLAEEYEMAWFPGDDLLAARPRACRSGT